MFFVKEVLEEVKKNGGYIGKKLTKKERLDFPLETLTSFVYQEDKSISKVVGQINDAIDVNVYKKVSVPMVTRWLKQNGLIHEVHDQELGKVVTVPTEKGKSLGIWAEKRVSLHGTEYILVVYGKQAQEYIVQHLGEIVQG